MITEMDGPRDLVELVKMPVTARGIWDVLQGWGTVPRMVALEKVTGRPRQKGAMAFAEHNGALRALCVAADLPTELVAPGTWQRKLGCLSGGDKAVTLARAQELFPRVRLHHWSADALLLAEYARRMRG